MRDSKGRQKLAVNGEELHAVRPLSETGPVGDLPADERVVMRHTIALNLDDFRSAPDGFHPRPRGEDAALKRSRGTFFSVIVPNYNGERFLRPLLAALDGQSFRDFEIILVDDSSRDASVAWVEEHHPDVRVIVNRQNLGFAKSCNLGAASARGRVVAFLNSDTEPEAEWLAELAKAVCQNPCAGMFASKVLLRDRTSILHTTGDMMGRNGLPMNRGVWERDLGQYDDRLEIFGGSGCAVAYLTEVWTALEGFDEDFWMYMEDVDFAFRAQLMGVHGVFVPRARVLHHLTATAGAALSSYYVGRNTIWTIAKNMPSALLSKYWTRIFAAQFRIAIEALRNVRGTEARARLGGQVVGLLTVARLLRKRRSVQARRTVDAAEIDKRLYG